jgi:putative glycosyltransferase (TIGR04348 family)
MIPSLKILMICPAPRWSRKGNRVTAARWAGLLKQLGHRVLIRQKFDGEPCDLMIALHARRSAAAIGRFGRSHPDLPLIVALTGTDLYHDIRGSRRAQQSLELATRLVVLQPNGLDELKAEARAKARVILQSAEPTRGAHSHARQHAAGFRVSVLGHLRSEKDPLRTALATRMLPHSSRIQVVHLGAALEPAMGRWADAESRRNPRYRWLGEVSYGMARRMLASSDLMVLSSRLEGGANVLSEAIVDRIPIVASDIPSTRGILGDSYPGLYPVQDTKKLADLLDRVERDRSYYRLLKQWCTRLRPRFTPAHERATWRRILAELL